MPVIIGNPSLSDSVRAARHLGGLSSRIWFTEYPLRDKIFETNSRPRFSMTQDCNHLLSPQRRTARLVGGYHELRGIQGFYRRAVHI